ncbi:unnamed protein product [Paramecium pentaurelia]|uniref:Uncharacterized protein n=1 Tax=Paramecium pentaurelia TaxID=43138 RepID=A0A8S1V0F0_9CILI|nr:unnamed protein product [Paramecium pentaurelia]
MSMWPVGLIGEHAIKYINGNHNDGFFINGIQHEEKQRIYTEGAEYQGGWINDNRQGKGNYKWTNGDEYYGDWRNNNREKRVR